MDASESKSSSTTMKSTTSPMGAISAGNAGVKKTALGFLDLPTEIRLKIYEYLLLARIGLLPLNTKTAYSVLSPVVLSHLWYNSIRGMTPTLGILSHHKEKSHPWSFHPAILSTCRTIHEEARKLLYGKNGFFFVDVLLRRSYERAKNESLSIEECENIFKYDERDWWRSDGPFLLQNSPLALFLNKIGPRNAASLQVVELMVSCIDSGNNGLTADLLIGHVPALKTLRVFISHEDYDVSDHFHERVVAVQHFCSTLRDSARGRFLLEVFDYKGDLFGAVRDLEARPGYSGNIAPLSREGKEMNASDTDSN